MVVVVVVNVVIVAIVVVVVVVVIEVVLFLKWWWWSGLQIVCNPASAAYRQGPNFVGRKGSREKSKRKKNREEKKGKKKMKKEREKKFFVCLVKASKFLETNLKIRHNLKSLYKIHLVSLYI